MMKKLFRFLLILIGLSLLYVFVLKFVYPPITWTQFSAWQEKEGLKRNYISAEDIPSSIKLAVMASEDQRFLNHNGFDWENIRKALKERSAGKSIRGASTISQQTAKNVFLWQGRSWVRKGLEVYFTFLIELIWGKERIMSVYLNVIEMDTGVYGIEAASKHYFNKSAPELSQHQANLIAATLPSPKQYTIIPLSKQVAGRAKWINRQLSYLKGDPLVIDFLGESKKSY